MARDDVKKIRSLRNKLHKSIKKNGLNSEETKYPEDSEMLLYFNMSYEALKVMTLQLEKFPTVNEWNKYAKENNYLSHLSLEYISKLDWNYLQVKIEREINFKKIQKN